MYVLLKLLRPHQWLKNLMLFFPPFLGGSLLLPGVWSRGVLPFLAFSIASSAGYIANDIMDREADLNHPRKANRPLAAGLISVPFAVGLVIAMIIASILMAFLLNLKLGIFVTLYLVVSTAYSCCLKNLPVVDLFCIATGFLLRLLAGGAVFAIHVSEWLFLSVLLLSLFLGAGKRLSEKYALSVAAVSHRKVLRHYPQGFLEGVLFMTGSAVLVTYTMYTLSHSVLLYSAPLCCFGLFRYIFRVMNGLGGDPTEALLKDAQLLLVGCLWVVMVGWGIYGV